MKREIINILLKEITITEEEILKNGIKINYESNIKNAALTLVIKIKNNSVNSMNFNKLGNIEESADYISKLFPIPCPTGSL